MYDLQDQLRLEEDLVLSGETRFNKQVKDAEDHGRGSTTGYARKLMQHLVEPVAEGVKEFCSGGAKKHGKFKECISNVKPDVVAYIALKVVLDGLHAPRTLSAVAMAIGLALEDEQRFAAFKELNPEYYTALISDFSRKNTKSYRHIRNVLAVTSKKKGLQWDNWNAETRLTVGTVLLGLVIQKTDLIKIASQKRRNKQMIRYVTASQESVEWIEKYNKHSALLHPFTKPCVIIPDDWTGINNGGYWSEMMRYRAPFIKRLRKEEEDFVRSHDLSQVFDAVNSIQRTPWRVNKKILSVMRECWEKGIESGLPKKHPIAIPKFRVDTKPKDMDEAMFAEFLKWKGQVSQLYTDEMSRTSKAFDAARAISMAGAYEQHDKIWFVHQCDFRGRVYASTSGLSPQGPDYSKALLEFSNGVDLGPHGFKWLCVHGANCYGVDKVSFDERIEWVTKHDNEIRMAASDPVSNRSLWTGADSPWMFLAFCIEYAEAVKNPEKFISHIPVGMDGSCNGLQNLSALLRDDVGGAATNLTGSDKPCDIYSEVAAKTLDHIRRDSPSHIRDLWLSFASKHKGIPRLIAKRPVMTLPYGSTRYSCFDFVYDAVREIDPEFFKDDLNEACGYMSNHLWDAIGETVVAARAAMDWLQLVAGSMASAQYPVWWVSPVGFPVYQSRKVPSTKRIKATLLGSMRLYLKEDTAKVSAKMQKQGIAPNFVHTLDAAHMMLTVNSAAEYGIKDFAMIHDSFGVHAGHVQDFRNVIRHSFVKMYKDNEPLHDLYTTCMLALPNGGIPAVPTYGTLDINNVLDSEYFFA